VLSVLLLPFFMLRRMRDRRRLKALIAADAAAERAEQESALAALLGEVGRAPGSAATPHGGSANGDDDATRRSRGSRSDDVSDGGTVA
jgi:hypothetical protein